VGVGRAEIEAHLDAFLEVASRWQLGPEAGVQAGGLRCPVSRVPMQWTEFSALPVAVDGSARGDGIARELARGLVGYLERVQRPDGTFDAGFCGDLLQPCNAAFALRPLSRAYARSAGGALDPEARDALARVLARAADACVDGGMTTPNHRWVAAGGLAHAARALDDPRYAQAANDWTRTEIDVDADGAFSEGSPNYALVSADAFLDLEALQGREDLGALARRCLGYLDGVAMPDGGFAAVASTRYDTDGSTDACARAAAVFTRLGAPDRASRALEKLWRARIAPGVFAPHVFAGAPPKAKLYPSVVSALACESLQRLLDFDRGALPESGAPAVPEGSLRALPASGLLRYAAGDFALAAGRGPNLLEAQCGGAALEGMRLLVHAWGWNALWTTAQELRADGMRLRLSSAPGTSESRLPQFHRGEPGRRTPGNAVPATTAVLELRCGPGRSAAIDLVLEGPHGAHALLELAARADQRLASGEGAPLEAPFAAPPAGRTVVRGAGPELLVIDHAGGSGHALQVEHYGYGAGDDRWSPGFAPRVIRLGMTLPARLTLRIAAA
jgi:hypothetical protein